MATINWLDGLIFCGYLTVVFAVGLYFAPGQRSNEDYFVGGRRMNWAAVGISLFATAFSSLSFVMLPREAAYADYHLLLTLLFIPLVITPVLWWVFVPLFLRLGVTSVYEYLEVRFHPVLRRLGTLLFAGYAIGWMGSMLYATGLILQAVLGLSSTQLSWTLVGLGALAVAYTAAGGVKAVIWTDVLQAATLGGAVLAVFLLALQRVDGGWAGVWRLGMEHHKFRMFHFTLDLSERQSFLTACAYALFMYLPGYTVSQVTVQRYLCVSGVGEARRSLLVNAVVVTLVSVLFFAMGTTIFAYYHQPGGSGFPAIDKQDQILPYFVATELPSWGLTGLVLAGLFAAVMSTIDSGINSMASVVAYDWLAGRQLPVAASRWLSVLFGAAIVGAALLAPALGEHVIEIIARIAGTFLGLLLGLFLLGMLSSRANTLGAAVGLAAGAGSLLAIMLWTEVPHWWYGLFACVPILAVGTLASRAAAPPRADQLRGVLRGERRNAD